VKKCKTLFRDMNRHVSGWCSSSHKVSHEWLATLWENKRANNRNDAPSPKTITAANNEENYRLTRAATLLMFFLRNAKPVFKNLLEQSALLGRFWGLLSAIKKMFHLVVCEHHKVTYYLFQVTPRSPCGIVLFRTKPIFSKHIHKLVSLLVFCFFLVEDTFHMGSHTK